MYIYVIPLILKIVVSISINQNVATPLLLYFAVTNHINWVGNDHKARQLASLKKTAKQIKNIFNKFLSKRKCPKLNVG